MTHSPGHQKWPNHQVREKHCDRRLQLKFDGQLLADSTNVLEVDEDGHDKRYYFPPEDVRWDLLEKTDTKTTCPFKGEASYYALTVGAQQYDDAAWSYQSPYDEHRALQGRLAFYDDKIEGLELEPLEE